MVVMPVSVVIPVSDDPRIFDCLGSIDEEVEIVLVLNRPTSQINNIVGSLNHRIDHLVRIEIPERCLGNAYNVGIEASSQPVVILIDSDCVFDPGAIRRLYKGTRRAPLCKGKVTFQREGLISRIVAEAREHHTGDLRNAYSPPLAMRKGVDSLMGGAYFDNDLAWCEDHEFDQRVSAYGVPIYFDDAATVRHPSLTARRDLKSAYRYGSGYRVGIRKGAIRPNWIYGGRRTVIGSVAIDIVRFAASPQYFASIARKKSLQVAVYMAFWMLAFAAGYYRHPWPAYSEPAESQTVHIDSRR